MVHRIFRVQGGIGLIELLVTVSILAVLADVSVPIASSASTVYPCFRIRIQEPCYAG